MQSSAPIREMFGYNICTFTLDEFWYTSSHRKRTGRPVRMGHPRMAYKCREPDFTDGSWTGDRIRKEMEVSIQHSSSLNRPLHWDVRICKLERIPIYIHTGRWKLWMHFPFTWCILHRVVTWIHGPMFGYMWLFMLWDLHRFPQNTLSKCDPTSAAYDFPIMYDGGPPLSSEEVSVMFPVRNHGH